MWARLQICGSIRVANDKMKIYKFKFINSADLGVLAESSQRAAGKAVDSRFEFQTAPVPETG